MELNAIQQAILLSVTLTALIGYLLYPKYKGLLQRAREKGCQCRAGRIIVWADSDCPIHGRDLADQKGAIKTIDSGKINGESQNLPSKSE